MNRGYWIFIVLGCFALSGACARRAAAPAFTPAVAGIWKLKSVETFPAASAPEVVRKIGTRGWWRADYQGPGTMTAELYELTSTAGGLEMAQNWRPAPDAVVWYTQRYFIVVKWRGTGRLAAAAFIRELEKQFKDAD
jgi:hypothetical protein